MFKLLLPLFLLSTQAFSYEVEKVYTPVKKEQPIPFDFKTDEEKALNQKKLNFFVVRGEYKNKKATNNIYALQESERKEIGILKNFNDIQESLFILRNLYLTGKKVNIAVVDDGISDFDKSVNLVKNDSCIYYFDNEKGFIKQPSNTDDFYGHGSNMISMIGHRITGIAPDSKIASIRVSNPDDKKQGSVLKGLTCAVAGNPDIINLSQSGWEKNSFIKNPTMNKTEEHYKDVYYDLINKDILLIASMDNRVDNFSKDMFKDDIKTYKNSIFNIKDLNKQILVVKSISKSNTSFAGDNKELTDRVLSVPLNTWYAWCGKENTMGNLCFSRAGNSSVTAVMSGIAALVKEANPHLKGKEIADILLKTANRDYPDYKQNTCGETKDINCGEFNYGAGIVDPAAAVRMAKSKHRG